MQGRFLLKGSSRLLMPQITNLLAQYQLFHEKDLGTVYGIPSMDFQERMEFKPQIQLYFAKEAETPQSQADNPEYVPGSVSNSSVISVRVMNYEWNTITLGVAQSLANKVKAKFMSPPFLWQKGKVKCVYTDPKKGYHMQVNSRTEFAGRMVIENVLDIQNHSPDWEKFTINKNDQPFVAYPETNNTEIVMGQSVKMPKKRPNVDVRFRYAVLHVYGLPNPVPLCDRTGKLVDPLAS
jgi:hypothetical protein